jgi:hypothetical protein
MHKLILIAFLSAVNIFSSCNRKQTETISTVTITQDDSSEGILVVSFISKGSGTDKTAMNKLKSFLDNSSAKKTVTYEVKSWGREGEKDYCIKTNNQEFIEQIKKEMSGFELVRIKENTVCRQ